MPVAAHMTGAETPLGLTLGTLTTAETALWLVSVPSEAFTW